VLLQIDTLYAVVNYLLFVLDATSLIHNKAQHTKQRLARKLMAVHPQEIIMKVSVQYELLMKTD
jgi:hypothetical protein